MRSNKARTELDCEGDIAGTANQGRRTWIQRPMFWRPSYLAPSAWHEHIPFAFWLMHVHRPRVFVELGVHYGVSYFAFCQAVSRMGLDTSCYGIDTFTGDAHDGTYDGNVYEQVKKQNDAQYSGFSTILRSTFDDTLSYFENGSVDLLHIDGMHSFDAVRADFESWQQKLSPRAVVVMHETNVRERGYGVARMFQDLCDRYPHFEFIHGHGLGILGIGKQQSKQMRQFFSLSKNEVERQMVREAFSALGQGCADAYQAERGEKKAANWLEQAESRDKHLKLFQQCLEKAKSEIEELNEKMAEQRNAVNAERERLAHEKGSLQGRLELQDSIRLQLMEELLQRQSRMKEAQAALEAKLSESETLMKAKQELESKNLQLEAELGTAALKMESLREERGSLELATQRLNEEREQLKLALASLEHSNRDLSETIVLFQSENSKLKTELTGIAVQLAESNYTGGRLQELEHQLSQERENAVGMLQLREEADAQIEKLTAENNNLRLGLEDARAQLNGLRGELDRMAEQKDTSAEIAVLNRKHAEQIKKITDELQLHKKQLSERFAELAEMTRMLEEQNGALKDKDEQASVMASGMDELKRRYEQAQEEIAILKNGMTAKTSSLEDRFREIAMLTQVVQQHETELKSKNEELQLEKERAAHFRDLLEAQSSAELRVEMPPENVEETTEATAVKRRTRTRRLSVDSQIALLEKSEILDQDWYLQEYEDVSRSGMTPAEHYVLYGAAEGRQPGPDFDTSWYVTNYPDVAEMGVNPAVHYLKYGKKEGRVAHSIKRSQ